MSEPTVQESALVQKVENTWLSRAASIATTTNLNPATLEGVTQLAQMMQKSPLLPKALYGDLGGTILILTQTIQLGLPWTVGLKELYIVGNKVSVQARLLRALVERDPNCLQFYVKEATNEKCITVVQRRGMKDPVEVVYTIQDAQKAGLVDKNPNYKTRPREMLIARSSSLAANTYFPSVCLGLDLEDPEVVYGGTAEIAPEPPPLRRRGRQPKPDPLAAFEAEEVPPREPIDVDEIYPRDETIEAVELPVSQEILRTDATRGVIQEQSDRKAVKKAAAKLEKEIMEPEQRPGSLLIDQRPPMDQSGEVDAEDAQWVVDYAVQHFGEAEARPMLRKLLADFGISSYSRLSEGIQKLTKEGYGRVLMALRAEAKKRKEPIPQDENDKPRRGRMV